MVGLSMSDTKAGHPRPGSGVITTVQLGEDLHDVVATGLADARLPTTAPGPVTMLNTPGGRSASATQLARA
jgi:hypothetical protein